MKNIIQIAGVRNQTDLDILLSCGVDYIGFPFRLSHHREDISEQEAARLIELLQPTSKAVLITYLGEAAKIQALSEYLKVKTVQLHGDISLKQLRILKEKAPHIEIIKCLIIGIENWFGLEDCIEQYSPFIHAFITDTLDRESGAQGATGKTHDWEISRRIVERSPKPVILAGGLNPTNVKQAIEQVRPAGVDAHTGLEKSRGNKDEKKVRAFITNTRQTFKELAKNKKAT